MSADVQLETLTNKVKEATGIVASNAQELKQVKAHLGELEQEFARFPATGFKSARLEANPVATAILDGDALSSVRAGIPSTGKITTEFGLRAALSNPDSGQAGDTAYPTSPQRAPGVQGMPGVRLSILDLLPVVKVNERTYEFVVLDNYINAADYQIIEGDVKAQTDLPTKLARAEVATIAHWLPASLQVLDDNAGLQNLIAQVLSVGCRQKLEHEILVGAGGDGRIMGIVPQAEAFTTTATSAADRVGYAITDLSAAGWNANAVVMNPVDWFAVASARADGGDGQYILGSPRDPSPAGLWGVPVVVSPSMPAGQALVLDTSVTALLDRQQVSVQLSRHDGDNFRRNLVTILAELRAGLALYAPSATRLVTLAVP